MALVRMTQDEFREAMKIGTVDAGTGTLFGVPTPREANKTGLTLVISTGGSGKAAIQQALETANEKLQVDYSQYVKFLVIDSATNELDPLQRKGIDTHNISSDGIQNRLLQNRSIFYKKFIPKDFPVAVIDDQGAGQQRLIGRVKMYDDNDRTTNDQKLFEKIRGYFDGDWADKKNLPIDIMVLTGISGGNGSGTFIDIAAIAKHACPDPSKVTVYGYIMLPDTAEKWAGSDDKKRTFHRNSYAALKELESYESLGMEVNPRKEVIHTRAFDIELSETNKPFNYPVLISGDYDEAVSMIAETIVDTIADSAGAFDQKSFYSNNEVVRNQRISTVTVSTGGALNNGAHPEDSHMYCGIGYAHASIPEKIVIPHVVGTVSRKLYMPETSVIAGQQSNLNAFCTKEKALSKEDFRKAMSALLSLNPNEELKADSLWKHILRQISISCKVRDNAVDITYNEVVDGQIGQYLNGFNVVAATNNAKEAMTKYVKEELVRIEEKAKDIMKQYGPRAILYLWDGTGNFDENGKRDDYSEISLKAQFKTVADGFMELGKIAGKLPPLLDAINPLNLIEQAKKNSYLLDWCQAARKAKETDVRCDVCKAMSGTNGIWEFVFATPFADFRESVERFAEVLEGISDFYSGEGKSLDSGDFREFAEKGGEINGINLCTDASMYQWVKGQINLKLNNVNVQTVRDELVDDFYKHTDLWTSNEEGKARKEYDEVMSRVCGIGKYAGGNNGMNLTITDYFAHVLEDVPEANQQNIVNNTVKAIYDRLLVKSAPSLKLKPQTPVEINRTIMLPKALEAGLTGAMIKDAFDRLLRQGNGNVQLAYSSVVDAIVCYQTSVANAICDINDLDNWENHYDTEKDHTTHRDNGEFPSLHITEDKGYSQYNEMTQAQTADEARMNYTTEVLPALVGTPMEREINRIYGTGLSWIHYPSLNISRYGDDFTTKPATDESKYRSDIFTKRVEEALRIGLIEWEQDGSSYKCFLNTIPKDWTNLKVKGYNQKKNGLYVRGKALFEYLKNQNPAGSPEFRKQIALKSPSFFGPQGFDFTEIMHLERWTEEKASNTRKAYMMRILRKSTELYQDMLDTMFRFYAIELELEKKEGAVLKQQAYKNFAEWFLNGVIDADEEQYAWDVVTTTSGNKEELITFSRRAFSKMDAEDKAFLKDGLKMLLVYRAFKEAQPELEVSNDDLNEVKDSIVDKLSDRQFDQMMDAKLEVLEKERDAYKTIVGKAKDSLDALMEHYNVDDDQMDAMQEIVDLYEAIDSVIEDAKSMF